MCGGDKVSCAHFAWANRYDGEGTYICVADVEFATDDAAAAEVAAKTMVRAAVLSVVLDFMSLLSRASQGRRNLCDD